jgi:RND family efflux transporter MFP subunit
MMRNLKKALLIAIAVVFLFSIVLSSTEAGAEEKKAPQKKGPPPAIVVVEKAVAGLSEPMAEYVGTVYYSHVSDIASEVAGKVATVNYDEGQRVKKGQVLVTLGSDMLQASLDGMGSSHEQSLLELERAQKDLTRMESLYRAEGISESLYDDHVFKVKSFQKKADALGASLRQLELQMEKTQIMAVFSGIVVKRTVEPGEWVNAGGTIAVVADDSIVDAVVDVPADSLEHIKRGRKIDVLTKGHRVRGTFTGFIPKGDVATRTFSIKIRFKNRVGLIEGMEARAILPIGESFEGILISRDAVINKFGQDMVFAMVDGVAKMIPIKVLGYKGMKASIAGTGLTAGMDLIVKGNERIRDKQPIRVAK